MDSFCLEANIHFPVDWVLLRDAARTLIKEHAVRYRDILNAKWEESNLSKAEAEDNQVLG